MQNVYVMTSLEIMFFLKKNQKSYVFIFSLMTVTVLYSEQLLKSGGSVK